MNIGIDARLIRETGVGRYIRNLIREMSRLDNTNEYTVFLRKSEYERFICPTARWRKVMADVPWHSLSEQLVMPWIFFRSGLDLVHIPYFNIPILYPGRFVVTIHDVIILHFDTGKASTLPWLCYKLRRFGYYLVLMVGLWRAKRIIAVSAATKQELIDHFHIDSKKIAVTYEGVDEKLKTQERGRKIIKDPYFLYVGNAYPHKNLDVLIWAFQKFSASCFTPVSLVLVGKDDYFYRRIKASCSYDRVVFFGEADDRDLSNLYQHAVALVSPSLMEGFGLPTLEALSFGCPVIASDIPVYHEILGDRAVYFNPMNPADLAKKFSCAKKHIQSGTFSEKYSWTKLASDTLVLYEACHRV